MISHVLAMASTSTGVHLHRALFLPDTFPCFAPPQGFLEGRERPAATAALEGGVLPLVCTDIDLVVAGRLHPEVGVREAG